MLRIFQKHVQIQISVLFVLMIPFIVLFWYFLHAVDETKWLNKERELINATEDQVQKIVSEYQTQQRKDYAISCIKRAAGVGKFSLINNSNIRGAYHAVILALANDHDAVEPLKDKLKEFFHTLSLEYKDSGFDEDMINFPLPVREYLWALLLLEGKGAYNWLKQELKSYPEHLCFQIILKFSATICWINGSEESINISFDCPYSLSYFDKDWVQRFVMTLINDEDNCTLTEENLVEILKRITDSERINDYSFYAQWRIKSAIMALRAITGDKSYKNIYTSHFK